MFLFSIHLKIKILKLGRFFLKIHGKMPSPIVDSHLVNKLRRVSKMEVK